MNAILDGGALTSDDVEVIVSLVDRSRLLETPGGRTARVREMALDPADFDLDGAAHDLAVNLVYRLVDTGNAGALQRLLKGVCKSISPVQHPELARLCAILGIAGTASEQTLLAPRPVPAGPVADGFGALSQLTQDQRIKDAVAQFTALFEISRKAIREVADYKHLHDQLHNLEQRVELPMQKLLPEFPSEETKIELEEYLRDFENVTLRLRDIAARMPVDDTSWIQRLEGALEDLRRALETDDGPLLRDVIKRVGREVALMPPRINKRLFAAASGLRLNELVGALKDVRDRAVTLRKADDELERVRAAIEILDRMNANLRALIDMHDRWQEVDTLLRAMEKNSQTLEDLCDLWSRAKELVDLILGRLTAELWVPSFVDDVRRLEKAIGATEVTGVSRSVRLMRRQVGIRFYNTDADLKKQCDELSTVGDPLATVLRVLQ